MVRRIASSRAILHTEICVAWDMSSAHTSSVIAAIIRILKRYAARSCIPRSIGAVTASTRSGLFAGKHDVRPSLTSSTACFGSTPRTRKASESSAVTGPRSVIATATSAYPASAVLDVARRTDTLALWAPTMILTSAASSIPSFAASSSVITAPSPSAPYA